VTLYDVDTGELDSQADDMIAWIQSHHMEQKESRKSKRQAVNTLASIMEASPHVCVHSRTDCGGALHSLKN